MIDLSEVGSDWFVSAGVKANRKSSFTVEQDGRFWMDLLRDIEGQAETSQNFTDIQRLVLRSLAIRQQLKKQGF